MTEPIYNRKLRAIEFAREDKETCTDGPAVQPPPDAITSPNELLIEKYKQQIEALINREWEALQSDDDPDWQELEEEFAEEFPLAAGTEQWDEEDIPIEDAKAIMAAIEEVNAAQEAGSESEPPPPPVDDPPQAEA